MMHEPPGQADCAGVPVPGDWFSSVSPDNEKAILALVQGRFPDTASQLAGFRATEQKNGKIRL
jgi:hypothetical protein